MGFRVVDKSSFSFETDLPPSCRNIHPSGILHAFRSTPLATTTSDVSNVSHREEHTFAWIENSLHIDSALSLLEKKGFGRSQAIFFIPYSTKQNWLDRYPHADPSLECMENGRCVVESSTAVAGRPLLVDSKNDNCNNIITDKIKKKRAVYSMLQDKLYMPDSERDELHIEIYNYLSWLHAKLVELERKEELIEMEKRTTVAMSIDGTNEDEDVDQSEKCKAARRQAKNNNGVDVSELQGALDKLEVAFPIILNAKLDAAEEEVVGLQQQQGEQQQGKEIAGEIHQLKQPQVAEDIAQSAQKGGAPFLEDALSKALSQLVAARELAGKPRRRSRKRKKYSFVMEEFDEMFQKLVQYKEEHGHCAVPRSYENGKLARWVNAVRHEQSKLLLKGKEFEEILPGKKILTKTLTAERVERLNSVGFVWSVQGPKVAWEYRFQELIEYYEMNGKWPSQSMGKLGDWVHKQRMLYSKNDVNYMKNKAHKLDEVGFEWTPRGNTRMTWDEGFEMLMEYGRVDGHYDVQCPSSEVDKKSEEYRLYKWVESLHGMYRSYKLGRQSGSLTDERILLLIKHGFEFRND